MIRKCKMNVYYDLKKVVFELLSYCNLHCSYCFYREKKHSKAMLSLEEIYHLINKFKEDGIGKLVLTGGEPTLHPDFISIAQYAIARIPKVSVCTNGVILHEKLEEQVIGLGLTTYTISIDSHIKRIHDKIRGQIGAFEQTMIFLIKLQEKKKNISLHITLHVDNIDQIHEAVDFCRQFSNDILISTIYYEYNPLIATVDREYYTKKANEILSAYLNDDDITLVGFGMSCLKEKCPDKKYVFMVNQNGELVDCYWKKYNQI